MAALDGILANQSTDSWGQTIEVLGFCENAGLV